MKEAVVEACTLGTVHMCTTACVFLVRSQEPSAVKRQQLGRPDIFIILVAPIPRSF